MGGGRLQAVEHGVEPAGQLDDLLPASRDVRRRPGAHGEVVGLLDQRPDRRQHGPPTGASRPSTTNPRGRGGPRRGRARDGGPPAPNPPAGCLPRPAARFRRRGRDRPGTGPSRAGEHGALQEDALARGPRPLPGVEHADVAQGSGRGGEDAPVEVVTCRATHLPGASGDEPRVQGAPGGPDRRRRLVESVPKARVGRLVELRPVLDTTSTPNSRRGRRSRRRTSAVSRP